jgi:hypothetical protein
MRAKHSTLAFSAAAGALLILTAAASAGDRAHRRYDPRPWYDQPLPHYNPAPQERTGPAVYYSYYYNHIPGFPVPIFPHYGPVVVYKPAVILRDVRRRR